MSSSPIATSGSVQPVWNWHDTKGAAITICGGLLVAIITTRFVNVWLAVAIMVAAVIAGLVVALFRAHARIQDLQRQLRIMEIHEVEMASLTQRLRDSMEMQLTTEARLRALADDEPGRTSYMPPFAEPA